MPAFRLIQPWLSKTKPPLAAQFNGGHPLTNAMKICVLFNEQKGNQSAGDFYLNYADPHYPAWNGHPANRLLVGTVSLADPQGTGDIGCVRQGTDTPWLDFTQNGAASILNGLGACSIAVRAQCDTLHAGGSPGEIFAGEDNSGNQRDFILRDQQNSQNWEVSIGTTGTSATISTAQSAQGTYDDVAATFDGANLKLYKNGILATSAAATGTLTSLSTHLLLMGSTRNNINAQYNGVLVYVYFWTRAIQLSEVQALVVSPYQMFSLVTPRVMGSAVAAAGSNTPPPPPGGGPGGGGGGGKGMGGTAGSPTELFLWQIQSLPDQVFDWRSQFISHGMNGYHHIGAIMAAYVASANVTLTISAFDGTAPAAITLPSTGGVYQRIWLNPTFNKGLLFRYSGHSTQPFQFALQDWIAYVKPWGDPGPYQQYRLIGEG